MISSYSQVLKISLIGSPYSGKSTFLKSFVDTRLLELIPENTEGEIFDAKFCSQPARITEFAIKKFPDWQPLYEKVLLFQWSPGPTSFATIVMEMLLRDCDGIFFLMDPTPGKLSSSEHGWRLFLKSFSLFHKTPLDQFPFLICYNHMDRFSEKLSKGDQNTKSSFLVPEINSEGMLTERFATIQEEKFFLGLNERINPKGYSYCLMSAYHKYKVQEPLDKMFSFISSEI